MNLSYLCIKKVEDRTETCFVFNRTRWMRDDDEVSCFDQEAEPVEIDNEQIRITAEADEFEVGHHYSFQLDHLTPPSDRDSG